MVWPIGLIAQNRCPVVGDTITVTGQLSILEVNGLKLPDLHPKTFPNRFQPICIMVKPYIGAGVGRVDRVVGQIAHIWLVSPKQKDANGNIDWKRPEPIPTDVFLEVTGKLIGQGQDRLGSPPYGTSEVTLEVSNIKNVDDEINNAVKAWRYDCLQWIEAQVTPGATALGGCQSRLIVAAGPPSAKSATLELRRPIIPPCKRSLKGVVSLEC